MHDASQLRTVDPAFTSPPSVAAIGDQQWLKAPDPRTLGNAFLPKDGSPPIDGGIHPRSIPALANLLDSTTTPYLTRDRAGLTRPQRNGWDIGATEAP